MFTDDERRQLDDHWRKIQQRQNAIRNNNRLTPEGKRAALARLYREDQRFRESFRERALKRREERIGTLTHRLFSVKGDDPVAVISYRDALDRAERAKTPTEAAALLDRAIRTGDAALQRAVLDRAFRAVQTDPFGGQAWGQLLDQFRAASPSQAEDIDELLALTGMSRRGAAVQVLDQARGHAPMPPELAMLTTEQIDALANQTPSEAA